MIIRDVGAMSLRWSRAHIIVRVHNSHGESSRLSALELAQITKPNKSSHCIEFEKGKIAIKTLKIRLNCRELLTRDSSLTENPSSQSQTRLLNVTDNYLLYNCRESTAATVNTREFKSTLHRCWYRIYSEHVHRLDISVRRRIESRSESGKARTSPNTS